MKELLKPEVYRGRVTSPIQLAEMWKVIEDRSWTEDDINLIRAVFAGIGRAAILDLLDSKNFEGKDVERVKKFTKAVFELQRLLVVMFTKMNDIRPRIMRSILEDDESCTAVVAHLFNGKRQNLENADLDMLKTVYDVTGKTDLWRQLLRVIIRTSVKRSFVKSHNKFWLYKRFIRRKNFDRGIEYIYSRTWVK